MKGDKIKDIAPIVNLLNKFFKLYFLSFNFFFQISLY